MVTEEKTILRSVIMGLRALTWTALGLAAFVLANEAAACATCFGDPDSPQTHGMNAAIIVMLGGLGAVLSVIGFFAAGIVRRNSATAAGTARWESPASLPIAQGDAPAGN